VYISGGQLAMEKIIKWRNGLWWGRGGKAWEVAGKGQLPHMSNVTDRGKDIDRKKEAEETEQPKSIIDRR